VPLLDPRGTELTVLENGFHFPEGPAFVSRYHAHHSASTCELTSSSMGITESSVSGFHSRVGRGRRKDPPSRAVIQFDHVALGMGPDPHGAFTPRSDRLLLSRRGLPRKSFSPAFSTAEIWTNTSLQPLSGWMKPYPFVALNHFTVPVGTLLLPSGR
jgi:hypothetical protein